jgi:hypothetical protein
VSGAYTPAQPGAGTQAGPADERPGLAKLKGADYMTSSIQNVLSNYLKILSIGIFLGVIVHVAAILDRSHYLGISNTLSFGELPLLWQILHFYFAILGSVAAVSLWKGEPWGVVLWLFLALNQLIMYLPLAHIFGTQPEIVMTHIATVGIYLALRLAEKGWLLIHGAQSIPGVQSIPAESPNGLD